MFEVLVFVYENYWRGDACPELAHLERKLNAVGFEADEIQDALTWLNDLNLAARGLQLPAPAPDTAAGNVAALPGIKSWAPSPHSMRVYSIAEQDHLGVACLGFVTFLETSGVLPAYMREIVIDRAMAAPAHPLPLDDFKIIVLMVYWSLGEEPDALVLDELCDDSSNRLAH
jgi:Smg protein